MNLTDDLKNEYVGLFDNCVIKRLPEVTTIANKIIANKSRYEAVGVVPWYVIGVIHNMEASLNFNCHLHNGDPLTAKTVNWPPNRPPKGDPPFTWIDSAKDAIGQKLPYTDWSLGGMLYFLERYNGFGYRNKGIYTPYLWSGTNNYSKGKYVRDGANGFDPNAVSQQIGAAAILKYMDDNNIIDISQKPKIQSITVSPVVVAPTVDDTIGSITKNWDK